MLLIPRKILRIDSRTRQIRQTALSQVELQEVAHQGLHCVFGLILDLVDSALEALEVLAVVVIRVEAQEALAFVVV